MSLPKIKTVARISVPLVGMAVFIAFTALPALAVVPTVTSYSVGTGVAGVTPITINGTGFFNGGVSSAVTAVSFGGGAAASHAGDTDIAIPVTTVPCAAVTGAVTVSTTGGSAFGPSFTVTSQGAATVSAGTGAIGATVTVTGTNFCGATTVLINGISATKTVLSNTSMTVTVPSTTVGAGTIQVTNSVNTAIATFTVTAATPTITSFTPTSGTAGTSVVITGTNFTGVTAVRFFNNQTATWVVNSTTQITATVPNAATTGQIQVVTSTGTGTSAGIFTVTGGGTHTRSVSFNFGDNSRVKGQVNVSDSYAACRSFVPVVIQKQKGGDWKWVDTTSTSDDGSYKTYIPPSNGTFRAKVNKLTLVNGAICGGDQSPTRHS